MTLALALAGLAAAGGTAHASVMRYALVVGANTGFDADGTGRPPLHHAEAEAQRVHDALIARCGFSAGPRTQLLEAPSRATLLAAIRSYREQIARDRRDFPNTEALFVLFFSGHGADQSILLPDGPVTGRELVAALAGVGADLQIRIFDACSSASLAEDGALKAKGLSPSQLFGLIHDLPDQALNSSGEVWFFSSAEGQTAFEHEELGGLFTHALIEAMSRAQPDDFGLSLDSIWDYARTRTVELAAEQGRVQTPTKVARMRSTGPLHLAWLPRPRATLVLGPQIAGTLGLFYGGDQMMTIDKSAGTTVEKSVYPGRVSIMVTKGGANQVLQRIDLAPGARVFVAPPVDARPLLPFGRLLVLVGKGEAADGAQDGGVFTTVVKAERDATTLFLGAEYRFASGADLVLAPRHVVSATARLENGGWLARVGVGFGFDGQTFSSWSYASQALLGSLQLGYGWNLGPVRLSPVVSCIGGPVWEAFGDGTSQAAWTFAAAGGAVIAMALGDGVAAEVTLDGGVRQSRGLAAGSSYRWTPAFGLAAGVTLQL